MSISVLILTRNEERNLPRCLETVAWSDDVVVYDSLSTDATVAMARRHGARVVARAFDNWAAHQNWGLEHIDFRHPWVFYIDADERVTPELEQAMRAAVRDPRGCVAFRIRRRDFYLDTWLKHAQNTAYYLRLFRPERMRYERLVNPVSIVDGEVGSLGGYLDHFPFSKGIGQWLERHNGYSAFEARQIIENRRTGAPLSFRKALFARDFHERRYHQKEIFYRAPFRPLIKFLFLYGLKRGFLDGRAGLSYASLQAFYEYMIVLKVRELEVESPERAVGIVRRAPSENPDA